MQHLYLLRHGQSEANAQHIVAGSHDSPLSPIGVAQAEYAGETAKAGATTAGHAARDGSRTAGRTIRDFFTKGPAAVERTA